MTWSALVDALSASRERARFSRSDRRVSITSSVSLNDRSGECSLRNSCVVTFTREERQEILGHTEASPRYITMDTMIPP